jgi:hypothetical protein
MGGNIENIRRDRKKTFAFTIKSRALNETILSSEPLLMGSITIEPNFKKTKILIYEDDAISQLELENIFYQINLTSHVSFYRSGNSITKAVKNFFF